MLHGAPDSQRGALDFQLARGRWVYSYDPGHLGNLAQGGGGSVCIAHGCVIWRVWWELGSLCVCVEAQSTPSL